MELVFAEEGLSREGIPKHLIDFLLDRNQIEIEEDNIFFKNFTGILKKNGAEYLIVPKKLAKHLNLIDEEGKPLENFYQKYTEKFNSFLIYILKQLGKENLIYMLSLFKIPVKEWKFSDSKIFKLILLLEKKEELISSLNLILTNPHKKLSEYKTYKNLEEASYIDSEILTDICQNPQNLHQTEAGIVEYNNKRYSPVAVLQYERDETYDTIENRFVKHFLQELEHTLSVDLKEFLSIPELQQIKSTTELALQNSIFQTVENLNIFPSNSQVLMKRTGYREIFQIYRLLSLSYIPDFLTNLDISLSLKDMATLWEYYVLLELLKKLKEKFGKYKTEINFKQKKEGKTDYEEAKFEFKDDLTLHFQKTEYAYSGLKFRPDFLILLKDRKIIFDAKFRILSDSKKDIFQNMHYYRDGLKTDAAVAVCLGEESSLKGEFFHEEENKENINLDTILERLKNEDSLKGIGYVNMKLVYRRLK